MHTYVYPVFNKGQKRNPATYRSTCLTFIFCESQTHCPVQHHVTIR